MPMTTHHMWVQITDSVVKSSLEGASTNLFKWSSDNLMKSNADKCRLLVCKQHCQYKTRTFWYKKMTLWETLKK